MDFCEFVASLVSLQKLSTGQTSKLYKKPCLGGGGGENYTEVEEPLISMLGKQRQFERPAWSTQGVPGSQA